MTQKDPSLFRTSIIIDCEAREIIRLVASVRPFVCLCVCVCVYRFPTGAEWLAKYSKRSSETQIRYTVKKSVHLKEHSNGSAFKMVVVSTGCAIAVDHAFNFLHVFGKYNMISRHISDWKN